MRTSIFLLIVQYSTVFIHVHSSNKITIQHPMRKVLKAKQASKQTEKSLVVSDFKELELPLNLSYSNYCSLSTKKKLFHKFYLSKRTSQTCNQNPFESRFFSRGGNVASDKHQSFKISPSKIYDKPISLSKAAPKQESQRIKIYRYGKLIKERNLYSSFEGQRNIHKITSFQASAEGANQSPNQIFITNEYKQKRPGSRKQFLRTQPSFLKRSRTIMGEREGKKIDNNWITLNGWETEIVQ